MVLGPEDFWALFRLNFPRLSSEKFQISLDSLSFLVKIQQPGYPCWHFGISISIRTNETTGQPGNGCLSRGKALSTGALLGKVSQPPSSVMTEGASREEDKREQRGEGCSPESET
jgi:hypothetical protein